MSCDKLKELADIAKRRGGKLLSKQWDSKSKMEFECFHGHVFQKATSSLKRGSWCPTCKAYHRTEEICRLYFEHIFGHKFSKIHPGWLLNVNGNRLELDGYSKECMVAFEYNGRQHYEPVHLYKQNDEDIKKCCEHEKVKRSECRKRGIKLVIISYKTSVHNFLWEIKRQLIELGHNEIDLLNWSHPSLKSIYTQEFYVARLKKALSERGFTLLDSEYKGETFKYHAKCNVCGKIRYANPYTLNSNLCKRCSGKEKKSLKDAQQLASAFGGKCLSTEYINNSTPLKWQCKDGHIWDASYNAMSRGNWCPIDGEKQRKFSVKNSWVKRRELEAIKKLEKVKNFAKENNLILLSEEYIDCDSALTFLCPNGHKWEIGFRAVKRAIKRGRSCTVCGPNKNMARHREQR